MGSYVMHVTTQSQAKEITRVQTKCKVPLTYQKYVSDRNHL